jgi:hypothetical protein
MKYDATLKKLFQRPPNLLLSHVLGEKIVVKQILPSEMITVGNLHPDLLFETIDGEILHTELQGYAMESFAVRNLIYFALVLRDYHRAPTQIVFWIGEGKMGVTGGLDYDDSLHYRYRLIDVRQLDSELLLQSPDTGEAIFGILCKCGDYRATVQRILCRIALMPLEDQREALAQLLILSGLRGLTTLVKAEVRAMPVTIDIHDNEFLEEIYQDGLKQGLQGLRRTLLQHLNLKFGNLPDDVKSAVDNADVPALERWHGRVIPSQTLAEVFDGTIVQA